MKKISLVLLLSAAAAITNATNVSSGAGVWGASTDNSVYTVTSTGNVNFGATAGRLVVRNHIHLQGGGVIRNTAASNANGAFVVSASIVSDATMNLHGTIRNEYVGGSDFNLAAIDGAKIYVGKDAVFEGGIAFHVFSGSLELESGSTNLSLSQLNLGKNGGDGHFNLSSGSAAIKTIRLGADLTGASVGKSGNLIVTGTAQITSEGGSGAIVGASLAEAAGAVQSESQFIISEYGSYATDSAFVVKSSGTLVLSPNHENSSAMLTAASLDFQREASGNIGNALVVHGGMIAPQNGEFYAALIKIENGGAISLNATELFTIDENRTVFQIRDFLEDNDLVIFENFDEGVWGVVDMDNIVFDAASGTIGLAITPIPEPATYAALLAFVSLAFAFYRRRQAGR